MYIVTVIPIKKGIQKDTLTYFTKKDVPVGSLVSIPMRAKKGYGLVLETRNAEDLKSELKTLSYSIRKIDNIEARTFLSSSFIESCKKIADYNASSVGAVISSLIPKVILDSDEDLSYKEKDHLKSSFYETSLLQCDDEERYATYRSIIREEFAKNKSVFFCLPTTENILNSKNTLEKGIEKYTYILHSGLGKKEVEKIWKEVIENPHPVLIIGTGSFLSIPRYDLGTIIIEKESSRAYKMQQRPFLDLRKVAEFIAREMNIRLILGDLFLQVETSWEEKNGNYASLSPLKFRSLSTASCEIINTRVAQDMKRKEWTILSPELKDLIQKTKENNERTFLFCARKGLYPVTVCSDCGTVVLCKNCKAPVVLYTHKGNIQKNLFVCNHCGERRGTEELCVHCNGWRLNPMGIGTEKVREEIERLIPETKVFLMDKDNITTHKQAVKIRDMFYATPGSIMIGTEMALTYLNQEMENTAVVSIDSYFSIPDFQINEKIFHILLEMRALSKQKFLIQTRQDEKSFGWTIFDYAIKGNLMDFYRDEIEDRKSIGYPPFVTYIKITIEGEKNSIKKQMEEVVDFMKPYNVSVFDAFSPGSNQKYLVHGLISIDRKNWIDRELLQKIRQIPPNFAVRINPASLL
jgi:primosomal protein N' (replication factor Y)